MKKRNFKDFDIIVPIDPGFNITHDEAVYLQLVISETVTNALNEIHNDDCEYSLDEVFGAIERGFEKADEDCYPERLFK